MTSPRSVSYIRTHRVVRDHRPWSHQRLAAAVGIAVGLCFVFVPQGCGGAAPALVVPDGIAGNVQACAIEHQRHVVGKDHTVTYELRLDRSGFVDDIALVDSTLGDEELEKCMASSLRSFTEDDLLLRPSPNVESERASEQSRTMVGHPGVLAACAATPPCLLTLVVLMGATAITVQIMVHAATTASKPTATTTAPPIGLMQKRYRCTAKCQSNGAPSGAYYVIGTSTQNCSEAMRNAKAAVRRGEYPRHCSCTDTDGFIGNGTECETHTR